MTQARSDLAQPFKKRTDYFVHFEFVEPGTVVYNYLEDCEYTSTEDKNVKLIGTVDEEWLTSEAKLYSTYDVEDGVAYPKEDGNIVWCILADGCEQVATSWGDVLTANRDGVPHGDGDVIAYADDNYSPNYDDAWVINGLVFENTYEPADM